MRSENKGAVVVPKDKVIPVETIVKLRGDFSRLPDEDRTRWEQAYGEVVRAMDTMTVGHEIQRVVRDVVEVSVEGGKTSVEEALAGLGNKAEVIAEQVQASVRGFVNSESGKNDSGLQVAWNDYGDLVPDYVKSQVERYGAVARQAWGRESGNTDELLIQSVAGEPEVNIGEVISDVNRDLGEKGVGSEVIEQGSGEPVVESVDLGGAATPTATSSHGDDEPGGADAGNAGGNSVGSEGEAAPKRWRVRLRVKDRPGRGGRRESAETQTEEKPVERTRRLLREGLRLIGPEFENLTLAQVMGELERLAADPSVDLSSNPRINNLRRALNVFDGLLGNEQQLPIARTMATHRTSGNYVDVYNGVLEYDCEAGDLALARERVDLMENGQLMPELVGVSRLFRMGELDQLQLDLLVTLSSQTRGREMVEVLGSDSAYLVGMSRTERITFPHKMSTLRRRVTLLRWGTRVTNGRLVVGLVDELQAKLSKKDSDQVKPREATVMGVERMQETQRANLEAMFVGRVLGAEDISVLTNSVDVIVGKEFGDLAALVKALIHMGGDVNRWKNGGHEELAKVGYSDVLAFITQMNHEPSKLILRVLLAGAGFVEKGRRGLHPLRGVHLAHERQDVVVDMTRSLMDMFTYSELAGCANITPQEMRYIFKDLEAMGKMKFHDLAGQHLDELFTIMTRFEAVRRLRQANGGYDETKLDELTKRFDVRLGTLNAFAILLHSGLLTQFSRRDDGVFTVHSDRSALMNQKVVLDLDVLAKNKIHSAQLIYKLVAGGAGGVFPFFDKATGRLLYDSDPNRRRWQEFFAEALLWPNARSWLIDPNVIPKGNYGVTPLEIVFSDKPISTDGGAGGVVDRSQLRDADVVKPYLFQVAIALEGWKAVAKGEHPAMKIGWDGKVRVGSKDVDYKPGVSGDGALTVFAAAVTGVLDRSFAFFKANPADGTPLDESLFPGAAFQDLRDEEEYRRKILRRTVRFLLVQALGVNDNEPSILGPNTSQELAWLIHEGIGRAQGVEVSGRTYDLAEGVVKGKTFRYNLLGLRRPGGGVDVDDMLLEWLRLRPANPVIPGGVRDRVGLGMIVGRLQRDKNGLHNLQGGDQAWREAVLAVWQNSSDVADRVQKLTARRQLIERFENGGVSRVEVGGPVAGLQSLDSAKVIYGGKMNPNSPNLSKPDYELVKKMVEMLGAPAIVSARKF